MIKFAAKTRKVNCCIVVVLPKEVVKALNIKENQVHEPTIQKRRIYGFGIFKGISPFMVEDELKAHE